MTDERWGTIALSAPLRVRLDGATEPHPVEPDLTVDPAMLRPGVRVLTRLIGKTLTIVGVANGGAAGGASAGLYAARDLTTFTAARMDRGNAPVRVAWLGDSISEGWNSDTPTARRRAQGLLADAINGGGRRGDGWLSAVYTSNHLTAEGKFSTTPGDGKNLFQDNGFGLGMRTLGMKNAAWREWTFTGDRVRIHYWSHDFGGADAEVKIDGAVAGTLGGIGAPAPKTWLSSPLARGEHTVRVTNLNTGGFVFFLEAAEVFDGDYATGAHVYDGSHAGFSAEWFNGFNTRWLDKLAAVAPSLVIVALGTNDAVAYDAITYDNHLAYVTFKIEEWLKNTPHSLAFVSLPERTLPYEPISPWSQYVSANRRMAAAFGGAHIDVGAWWKPSLTSNDGTHPTPQGQRIIAAAIAHELGV